MTKEIPFKIHDLKKEKPTNEQANQSGQELYWNYKYGWRVGIYAMPYEADTHWTYAPNDLLKEDARNELIEEERARVFKENGWTVEEGYDKLAIQSLKIAYLLGTKSSI